MCLGTTDREPGPFGVRNGVVTEFERATAITFRQPMTLRLGGGVVDVTLRYTLTPRPAAGVTHVARVVTITVPPRLRLFQPVLVRAFRTESTRTLMALRPTAARSAESSGLDLTGLDQDGLSGHY